MDILDDLLPDELTPRYSQDLAGLVMRLLVEVAALHLLNRRYSRRLDELEQRLARLEAREP